MPERIRHWSFWRWPARLRCHRSIWCCQYIDRPNDNHGSNLRTAGCPLCGASRHWLFLFYPRWRCGTEITGGWMYQGRRCYFTATDEHERAETSA